MIEQLQPTLTQYETNELHQTDDLYVGQSELTLYLKRGHYELQDHSLVNMNAYFSQTNALAEPFNEVYLATSEDMSASRTNNALAKLFIHVNRALNSVLLREAQNLQSYAEVGRNFYNAGPSGTLTFAVILLAIGAEQHHDHASLYSDYLNCIGLLSDHYPDDALKLAEAIIQSPGDLNLLEQNADIKAIKMKADELIHRDMTDKSQLPQTLMALS